MAPVEPDEPPAAAEPDEPPASLEPGVPPDRRLGQSV
jgi:hypothetical protein